MNTILLDGKYLSEKLLTRTKNELGDFCKECKLIVLTVGNDPASKVYIKNKIKACDFVGIQHEHIVIDETMCQVDFANYLIELMNNNPERTGIILQLPAPDKLVDVFDKVIKPRFDVDGFGFTNRTLLYTSEQPLYYPATPKGIIILLKNYNIPVEGKHVVILGRSEIVGKPMAKIMLDENATVTICHSKTTNLIEITKTADILISAIGKPKFVKESHVKEGAVVIDVGINRTDKGFCGDVDFDNVMRKCSAITPVPRGVGPMTVYALIENVINTAQYSELDDDNDV